MILVVKKGIPNQANYMSECYPLIPTGNSSAVKYQREAVIAQNRRKSSMDVEGGHQRKYLNKRIHRRHRTKNSRYQNEILQEMEKKKRLRKIEHHKRGHSNCK